MESLLDFHLTNPNPPLILPDRKIKLYKIKQIVTSQETTIDDFQGSIDNWEIPRVHKVQIYQIPK